MWCACQKLNGGTSFIIECKLIGALVKSKIHRFLRELTLDREYFVGRLHGSYEWALQYTLDVSIYNIRIEIKMAVLWVLFAVHVLGLITRRLCLTMWSLSFGCHSYSLQVVFFTIHSNCCEKNEISARNSQSSHNSSGSRFSTVCNRTSARHSNSLHAINSTVYFVRFGALSESQCRADMNMHCRHYYCLFLSRNPVCSLQHFIVVNVLFVERLFWSVWSEGAAEIGEPCKIFC